MYKGKRIELGHPVKILSSPGKRDGFSGEIKAIRLWNGRPQSIDVRDPHSGGMRTIRLTRVKPLRKPKVS